MEIYQIMADNKVINEEIEDPIEHEVAPSARGITEQLLRHDSAERPIEKIDDFGYYLREFVHLLSNSGAKLLQKSHIRKFYCIFLTFTEYTP